MDTWVWIVLAVLAVIVVALIAWAITRKRRTESLHERFGPNTTVRLTRTAVGAGKRTFATG